MDLQSIAQQTARLNSVIQEISGELNNIEGSIRHAIAAEGRGSADPFVLGLMVFVLACFVGYYVVWKVTPALHSPLMAVTNAISSVIILGALVAAGPAVIPNRWRMFHYGATWFVISSDITIRKSIWHLRYVYCHFDYAFNTSNC